MAVTVVAYASGMKITADGSPITPPLVTLDLVLTAFSFKQGDLYWSCSS